MNYESSNATEYTVIDISPMEGIVRTVEAGEISVQRYRQALGKTAVALENLDIIER